MKSLAFLREMGIFIGHMLQSLQGGCAKFPTVSGSVLGFPVELPWDSSEFFKDVPPSFADQCRSKIDILKQDRLILFKAL